MHGSAFAFPGTGADSRCFFPAPPLIRAPPPPPEANSQVLFPQWTRFPSASVRAKAAAAANEAVVASNAVEMSFYELLGVPESGSMVEIKQAYKQLALKYHPDVSPPDRIEEHTRKFIEVQEAYETLSDPFMRALYDTDMARGLHLAFSARRRSRNHEEMEDKSAWKNRWEEQLEELTRRSMNKESSANMSWGARMRRQWDELREDA